MRILLVGDIHANRYELLRAMRYGKDQRVDRVFFLGDFGWKFEQPFLDRAEYMVKETGLLVEFIDGNHEDFNFLYSLPVSEDGYRYVTPHVRHIPRGTILELDGKNVVCMGGGASIDRIWRVENESWWPQELITDEELFDAIQSSKAAGHIHAMFSHDGPVLPHGSNKFESFIQIADDIRLSNANMRKIHDLIYAAQPAFIYHGHHHSRFSTVLDTGFGLVHVESLDCDGSRINEMMLVVDTDDWE